MADLALSTSQPTTLSQPDSSDDYLRFLGLHETFITITVHTTASSVALPEAFLTWLGSCCVSLAHEIHAALPILQLNLHPAVLAPAPLIANTHPQTLRYLIGVAKQPSSSSEEAEISEADLSTRLTCGLQAFLKQIRNEQRTEKGVWLNARYVTRADLGQPSTFQKFPLTSTPDGNAVPVPASTAPAPSPSPSGQDHTLSTAATSAIAAALRILPEPDTPTPLPTTTPLPAVPPRPPGSGAAAPKLRPVADVLDRLRWDAALGGTGAYVVGYWDRFSGILEIELDAWQSESTEEDFVPLHRVSYVKRKGDGRVVWWREGRRDEVFGSGWREEEE